MIIYKVLKISTLLDGTVFIVVGGVNPCYCSCSLLLLPLFIALFCSCCFCHRCSCSLLEFVVPVVNFAGLIFESIARYHETVGSLVTRERTCS
jgi:hypothetical protein